MVVGVVSLSQETAMDIAGAKLESAIITGGGSLLTKKSTVNTHAAIHTLALQILLLMMDRHANARRITITSISKYRHMEH